MSLISRAYYQRLVSVIGVAATCLTPGLVVAGNTESLLIDQDLLEDPAPGTIRIRITEVASGLNSEVDGVLQILPTDLAAVPDDSGRLCVLTLGGTIRLIDPVQGLVEEPYLITANKNTEVVPANFGMISMVFHPQFAQKGMPGFGKFYVIETEVTSAGTPDFDGSLQQNAFGGQHHDVIYEYTTTDPSSDVFAGTKREVLRVEQPGWDHNLFDMTFGLDDEAGIMYISSGDGGNASEGTPLIRDNPQFLGNVFGKTLRIDPLGSNSANGQYGIPADNPFLSTPDALPELYTYGHRSCYRLTTDSLTGDLWLGEVGQIQVEEVNRLEAGANYGWPFKEGSFLFDELDFDDNQIDPDTNNNGTGDFADANGLTDPIFEVDHQTARSLTGGYIYRGDSIPGFEGNYIFGDAIGNGLFYGNPIDGPVSGGTGGLQRFLVDPTGLPIPFGVISIGEDRSGELYLLTGSRKVLRLDPWRCSNADFVADGVLDFFDISAFLVAFSAGEGDADLNDDLQFDFFDVSTFLTQFNQGCP